MKKTKKKALPSLILLVICFIIIIGIVLFIVVKKNNEIKINKTDPNGNQITIIDENNINTIQFIDSDDKDDENKEKKYEKMTAKLYANNTKDAHTYVIQDVIHNNNGTITLKGRVYKYIDIPETLSFEEYNALLNGKSLNILGEKVTKVEDDSKAKDAGYEIALKVENKKIKNEILYFVNKNEDGTANLYNGSESSIAEGTDVYLEITLKDSFNCYVFDEKMSLKDYYKKNVHIADKNKTRLLHSNADFIFEEESDSSLMRIVFNTIQ